MEDIKKWLEDPEHTFAEGLMLYMKYGKNRNLKNYFFRKQDLQKLEYELGKFVPGALKHPVAIVGDSGKEYVIASSDDTQEQKPHEILRQKLAGEIRFEDLPEEIRAIYSKIRENYCEMRSAHEKMKLAETDDARAALRSQLDNLDNERRSGWEIFDKWMDSGELPVMGNNEKLDVPAYKTIPAARTALTRFLKKLDESPDIDPAEKEILIEKAKIATKFISDNDGKFDKLAEPLKKYGILG